MDCIFTLCTTGSLLLAFTLTWGVSSALRNVGIVDVLWGLAFVIVGWITYGWTSTPAGRNVALLAIVTIWGLRLSGHLLNRAWGKPEDFRYAAMREKHGSRFPLVSLFSVFLLQAGLAWFISLPIQSTVNTTLNWSLSGGFGVLLATTGILFESLGDWQLARFKSNPENRGKVMCSGLWRYTRHPNYFGDFLVWWGIFVLSFQTSTWWWTVWSPAVMSFFLLQVSGVRLLEQSLQKRLAGYEEYVHTTSAFFPLPPRRSRSQ
ncbi:MAG: DUF1295 domain-containing protein [Planctomycetales bacterium]|nr:DUF1295 domain-containing protein [Planctomycetales bacterium]